MFKRKLTLLDLFVAGAAATIGGALLIPYAADGGSCFVVLGVFAIGISVTITVARYWKSLRSNQREARRS